VKKKVEEATNLWCTWMGEIHTNLRKMGTNSPLKRHGREEEVGQNGLVGLGEEDAQIYTGQLSAG